MSATDLPGGHETVSVYLTRHAQTTWPTAVVYESERGDFRLARDGETSVGLGRSHGEARQAIGLLARAYGAAGVDDGD